MLGGNEFCEKCGYESRFQKNKKIAAYLEANLKVFFFFFFNFYNCKEINGLFGIVGLVVWAFSLITNFNNFYIK